MKTTQKQSEAVKSSQKQSEAVRSSQKQSEAVGSKAEQSKATLHVTSCCFAFDLLCVALLCFANLRVDDFESESARRLTNAATTTTTTTRTKNSNI